MSGFAAVVAISAMNKQTSCAHSMSLTTCAVCYSELREREAMMLEDIHSAWLALADGDIDKADRLLVKWVSIYREKEGRHERL